MVYLKQQRPEKVTVPAVRSSKERGEKLVCLTAYDYPTARIVDEAGTDIILVGDSLGNVVLGYDSTVPVTLEEMLHHTRAVRRGVERALLVSDMPYGSYHTGADEAVRAALLARTQGRHGHLLGPLLFEVNHTPRLYAGLSQLQERRIIGPRAAEQQERGRRINLCCR